MISQGDRGAILVQSFKTDDIDRCIVRTPAPIKMSKGSIAIVNICKYFKGDISSKDKFHITVGHQNIMADVYLFLSDKKVVGHLDLDSKNFVKNEIDDPCFDISGEYQYVHQITKERVKFGTKEMNYQELAEKGLVVLAYLHYQKRMFLLPFSFYIGSRLDFHAESKLCRIAFSGKTIFDIYGNDQEQAVPLKLLSEKRKFGVVEKKFDEYTLIIKEMFKKETNINLFIGKIVYFADFEVTGKLNSTFGASGKIKVVFNDTVDKLIPDFVDKRVYIINKKYQKIKNA